LRINHDPLDENNDSTLDSRNSIRPILLTSLFIATVVKAPDFERRVLKSSCEGEVAPFDRYNLEFGAKVPLRH
jgi:hypothetical protein